MFVSVSDLIFFFFFCFSFLYSVCLWLDISLALIWFGVLFLGFHNDCGSDFYLFIYVKNSFFLCEMDEIYLNGLVMCKLHLGRHTHVILASYLPLLCYNFSKIAPVVESYPEQCPCFVGLKWRKRKEGLRKT